MARPLRLQFPGATYHVISRGNNRSPIYMTDSDRHKFLELLGRVREKFSIRFYAYCLMRNHFHLLLETAWPNLSKAMQYLNGSYSSYFNRTHSRVGHLLQGRYRSILVDEESYLWELTRYIHLNPVASRVVKHLRGYQWSSYRSYAGWEKTPEWLASHEVLERFGSSTAVQVRAYRGFVEERVEERVKMNPLTDVLHQCVLGSKEFIDRMKARVVSPGPEVSYRRGLKAPGPEQIVELTRRRGLEGIPEEPLRVYLLRRHTDLTLREISERFGGGHYSRVSQTVRRFEKQLKRDGSWKKSVQKLESNLSNVKV